MSFSKDLTRFVSSSEDGAVKVWNKADGRLLAALPKRGSDGGVVGCALSHDARRVLVGHGAVAEWWDVATRTRLSYYASTAGDVTCVDVSPVDRLRLVVGTASGQIHHLRVNNDPAAGFAGEDD